MKDFDLHRRRREIELEEGWDNFYSLPSFKLPPGVEIQMVPPKGGAFARIILRKEHLRLSIYFDALDRLGSVGAPYYELYPNLEGDCSRYLVGEEDKMAEEIAAIFSANNLSGE